MILIVEVISLVLEVMFLLLEVLIRQNEGLSFGLGNIEVLAI